ncbi:regulator of (H+)-ATPase in vacuolar membrane [Malassezia pachydermatis]
MPKHIWSLRHGLYPRRYGMRITPCWSSLSFRPGRPRNAHGSSLIRSVSSTGPRSPRSRLIGSRRISVGRQSFRRCGGMCNYAMVDVLPTLARQWASLGASHAPRSDVPIDSPRVAASLNTFAHLICESKQLYLSAQASGRRINVFSRRNNLMQCLSFDDVPGSRTAHIKGVSGLSLGFESPTSDNVLLIASIGSIVAIWRLDAINMAKMGQVPVYKRWRLDGTLPMRGQLVSTTSITHGRLAIGSNTHLSVWTKGTHASSQWRMAWSVRTPRPLLRVRWSPQGEYVAAVPLADTRVMVWHVSQAYPAQVTRVAMLRHTRTIHSIDWRQAEDPNNEALVLVVIALNNVAYLYAPVPGEQHSLRQWAAIDVASDVRDVSYGSDTPAMSEVVSLMYCDAHRLSVALKHDMDLLEQQEQMVQVGVEEEAPEVAHVRTTRLKQLRQYRSQAPDLFFALMKDGSMVVYAVLHIRAAQAHLLQTLMVLRIPPCISTELSQGPLYMEFFPLAPPKIAIKATLPTAVIHAQTASGLRGSMAVSMALLLDGDLHGLFVQDMMVGAEGNETDTDTSIRSFLQAEHRSDILSLELTNNRSSLLSFSRDGVLIWWRLVEMGGRAIFRSIHQTRLRDTLAACSIGDGPHIAALDDHHVVIGLINQERFEESDAPNFSINDVTMQPHDIPAISEDTMVAFHSVNLRDGALLILCTSNAELRSWTIRKRAAWAVETHDTVSLDATKIVSALIVPHLHPGHTPALLTMSDQGQFDVYVAPTWERVARVNTGLHDVALMRVDASGHVAILSHTKNQWHVQIRDLSWIGTCDTLVHAFTIESQSKPSMAWTTVEQLGSILAVSADNQVHIVAESGLFWSTMALVDLNELSTGHVSHVKWICQHRLLISSSCQLFMFDTHLQAHGSQDGESLVAALAERHKMRPYYEAVHLRECLLFGMLDNVQAIVRAIEAHLHGLAWPALTWSWTRTSLTQGLDLPADQLRNMAEKVSSQGIAEMPHDDSSALAYALRAVHTVATSSHVLDEYGLQFLVHWVASQYQTARLILAFRSAEQEALLSKVQSMWIQRPSWDHIRTTGVFCWVRSREALVPIMEQVARAAFSTGDDINPVRCTLFYLALKNLSMVRSVWRRAVGHSDQNKMKTFLANDFTQERWRVAAQKNAFALISQRRFEFAAAFFLLGGAISDAVNVCVRHLHDLELGLALARIFEEDEFGPVFLKAVRQYVLPHAKETGDRWLCAYAHDVLGEPASIATALTEPLSEAMSTEAVPALDRPDPGLLLLLEQCKRDAWYNDAISPQRETQYVSLCARLLQRMGCDFLCVSVLRSWSFARITPPPAEASAPSRQEEEVPAPKIKSLIGERRPPPAQSAAEFDMSAFGL